MPFDLRAAPDSHIATLTVPTSATKRELLLNALRAGVAWLKKHGNLVKWPIAIALLATLFLWHREDFFELASRRIEWKYLLLGLFLCGGSIVLTFVRWYLLVWAQDFPFKVGDALRLGFIGFLFNYLGPGAAGGDLVKAGMIAGEQTSRKGIAAATVLLDRILGLLALFLVGALAVFFQTSVLLQHPFIQTMVWGLWIGTLAGFAGLAIMLHPAVPRSRWINWLIQRPKIGGIFGSLVNAVLLYQTRRRVLVLAVGISVVGHIGMLSTFYFCAKALNLGDAAPSYWAHLMLIPGAELAAVIPLFPGGVGVLEVAVQLCYGIANQAAGLPVSADEANAAGFFTAIAYRAITIVVAAVGAGYYITARKRVDALLEEESSHVHADSAQ